MWDLSSLNQGSNLCLLHWKHGVLTTEPAGKSLDLSLASAGCPAGPLTSEMQYVVLLCLAQHPSDRLYCD